MIWAKNIRLYPIEMGRKTITFLETFDSINFLFLRCTYKDIAGTRYTMMNCKPTSCPDVNSVLNAVAMGHVNMQINI